MSIEAKLMPQMQAQEESEKARIKAVQLAEQKKEENAARKKQQEEEDPKKTDAKEEVSSQSHIVD